MNDIVTSADAGSTAPGAAEDLVAAQRQRSAEEAKVRERAAQVLRSAGVLLPFVVVLVLVIAALQPAFLSGGNIQNVLFQAAFTGIVACGMTLLIAGGLIDLSVGGVMAVSAIVVAMVLPHTFIGAAILLAVVVGAVLGLVNGLVVSWIRIPPFIATLGALHLYRGVAFIITDGKVVPVTSNNYRQATTGLVAGIPVPLIVFVVVLLLTWFVLQRTYVGRGTRAIGSSERAAALAGVPVTLTKIIGFVLTGAFAGLAGALMAGRLSSAEGNMATGFEMGVIAAVVVGGTSLKGGRGTVLGTMPGALFFAILTNALNLLGVASYWQYVVLGSVLVVAIAIGSFRNDVLSVRS